MATMMDAPVTVTSSPSGGSRLAQMQVSCMKHSAVIPCSFAVFIETAAKTFESPCCR
jgi:hypothetical protein